MRASWILPTVLVLVLASAADGAAGWWRTAWTYRREVIVPDVPRTELPGDEIAVVDLPTGGLCKADGSDFRVVTAAGAELPLRVLMMGPGDWARIAFSVQPGVKSYYVYFGNAEAKAAAEALDLRRGALLEMWARPRGEAPRKVPDAQRMLESAKRLLGRDLVESVFLGHNPFAPDEAICARYTAWIALPAAARYDFALSSQNASFLLIGDTVVVSNGGSHGVDRYPKQSGSIDLQPGLHRMTVYHVSDRGNPTIIAAWRPPGQRHLQPIPSSVYAPFARGVCGVLEQYAKSFVVDFYPQHAGETFLANRYYQRYRFEAKAVGHAPQRVEWRWDFGDGQTATAPAAEHVYLVPGEYAVTLTARTSSGEFARTNRVFVSRPWDRVTQNELDALREHARIVLDYDFAKLTPVTALAEAVLLLKRADSVNGLLRAGEAMLQTDSAPPEHLAEVLPVYADSLVQLNETDKAIAGLRKAATMTDDPEACAQLLVLAARLHLDEKGETDKAMELFQNVLTRYSVLTTSAWLRRAKIGVGDVWRVRGEKDKAAAAYESAGILNTRHRGKDAFVKGDFARHVEAYIRDREYADARTYLDDWAETFPADKLEGYWSLLHVHWCQARSLDGKAAREAETLVRVHPASNYAAELLFLAADSYARLQRPDQQKDALERITRQYPESPFAKLASETLQK